VLKDMVAEHGLPTPICWVHLPLRGTVNKRYADHLAHPYMPTHDAYTSEVKGNYSLVNKLLII
jgi:hypothetical protein